MTKIICTIGPNTSDNKSLIKLKKAGMDVVRLNGSHSDLKWHKKTISTIRKVLNDTPIIFDLPGQKIRVGNLQKEKNIFKGQLITFTKNKKEGENKIPINTNKDLKTIIKNKKVYADDANLLFKIIDVSNNEVFCKAITDGKLKKGVGINLEFKTKKNVFLTKKEKKYIRFADKNLIDFIGISYAKSKLHLNVIKKQIKNNLKIIAKIEDKEGLDNASEIIKGSDAIMIDRGDLSASSEITNVTIAQKKIIKICNKYSKPSIVATDLLSSLISNSIPTKSEVSDITNAIYDGCSATMLSQETVLAKKPEIIVREMRKIINTTLDNKKKIQKNKLDQNKISQTIAESIVSICNKLPITKVVVITKTGYAAQILGNKNLSQKILAVSNNLKVVRMLNLIKNTQGIFIPLKFATNSTNHILYAIKKLWEKKKLDKNDLIISTAIVYPKKGNNMNLIQIHKVDDILSVIKSRKNFF